MRHSIFISLMMFTGMLPLFTAAAAPAPVGAAMLPAGGDYDGNIPKPADVFGFEAGTQHIRHDQLVNYFRALAEKSDRVRLETIGRTHEGREQLLAIISAPENLARLDEIRERHLAVARGDASPGSAPVVLWQGFSVHGDESSGSNAVPLYAWHLAASRDGDVAGMLKDVVVLIDPSLNPDGMGRFAAWATSRRGQTVVSDPAHQEHNQPWPSGRGNHYWFDLNRDWMLLQHPESRNRINVWNRWRPHVVTDHHEMGPNSTYFFQPGVPERTHPLTPGMNQTLTGRIAEFHARRLDAAGRFYYTKETFDDFYYGKGSTYPDITGGVGILFEQATSAGQAIESPYGVRTFAESVHNQLITALSTLEAAHALRDELRRYQASFFADARKNASGAWVIGDAGNATRAREFLKVLAGHGIRFRPLTERVKADGEIFEPGRAWVVPMQQEQARLIEAMFETRTEFASKVFYDVSTWTLPLAFDLPYARTRGVPKAGEWADAPAAAPARFEPSSQAVAYAFSWNDDNAPALLQALLGEEIKAFASDKPLTVRTVDAEVALDRGSVVVPLGIQRERREDIVRLLSIAANEHGLAIHAVRSGLATAGVDLGSNSLRPLKPVKPLLVTGRGVNPLEAGEVWFVADTRLGLPLTQVDRSRLAEVDLGSYTHIILVNGDYYRWADAEAARLHDWLSRGGVLITQQAAATWATDWRLYLAKPERDAELAQQPPGKAKEDETADKERQRAAYADYDDHFAETLVSGAILRTDADLTHPLAFGLPDRALPVFKSHEGHLPLSATPYGTVLQFTDAPLVSGYVSDARLEEIAGSGALLADRVGKGLLIRAAIDPVFRAYWHGTQRLLVNSLYFAQMVRPTVIE